jgi:hypothetical protein
MVPQTYKLYGTIKTEDFKYPVVPYSEKGIGI